MNIRLLMTGLLCFVSIEAFATKYNYADYSVPDSFEGGKTSIFLDISAKRIASTDWNDVIFVCGEASEFHCFSYPAVSFYVPKARIAPNQKWVAGGVAFQVLRKDIVKLFGLIREVWVIKATRPDRDDFFYYSESNGLIAIKHVPNSGGQVQFFVITGVRGFPR